jgi:hypothetical protein
VVDLDVENEKRDFVVVDSCQHILCKSVSVTAGGDWERNPGNSRWVGRGLGSGNGHGRSGDVVEGQGAAGDVTFRDSDGGVTRADLA